MSASSNKDGNTVVKDIHCPYCGSDNALLLSRTTSRRVSLQLPAYGLKFIFSLLYLSLVQIWINGFKLVEAIRVINTVTYGFCPYCGNTYSMAPPDVIKEEVKEPRFCKVKDGKVVMGLCKGISEYTGISLLWVRIMTVLYGLTVIGAILYFLIGACLPFKEDAEKGVTYQKLYRVRRGKDILGLCRGFSEFTGIPVMWVRIFTVLLSSAFIGIPLYFILSAFIPFKEDVEQGITRKKLYKIKKGKIILGLCAGFSEYTNIPLWLVRLLTVVLVVPMVLYWIIGAIVPTKED